MKTTDVGGGYLWQVYKLVHLQDSSLSLLASELSSCHICSETAPMFDCPCSVPQGPLTPEQTLSHLPYLTLTLLITSGYLLSRVTAGISSPRNMRCLSPISYCQQALAHREPLFCCPMSHEGRLLWTQVGQLPSSWLGMCHFGNSHTPCWAEHNSS